MSECSFCRIISDPSLAAVVLETKRLIVFADHRPIRRGHVQIVPRDHIEVFDDLPAELASEIIHLGQRIAKAQKQLYQVRRVGFAFTGNEVAHVHAHVLPLYASDDITSARYANGSACVVSLAAQQTVAEALSDALRLI